MRAGAIFAAMAACSVIGTAAAAPAHLAKIQHIIVIFEENHSFDNLYGGFPHANGLKNAGAAAKQVDVNGNIFAKLPRICARQPKDPHIDPQTGAQACGEYDGKFPPDLPNAPFDAGQFVPLDEMTRSDLVHRFYQEQAQIDHGKMDRFAAISNAGGLTMGYFDASKTALWKLAREYTLADNFFHGVFGGSFLNHIWLACACAPVFPDAPKGIVAQLDENGNLVVDGVVTPDGGTVPKDRAVNTIYPAAMPHPSKSGDPLLPPQTMQTIGGELTDQAHVSWAWYSGGFADAMAGFNLQNFQYHHQPYVYFARYTEGTEERKAHLKDGSDFERDIDSGTLPAVAFYKPVGELNQHPNYASIKAGDCKAAELIRKIQANKKLWKSSVIIVAYDENGGQWDHVAPPRIDPWGPGTRVPAIIISPFAKRHYVDHTQYDTTSILKFIEVRFGLTPLGSRDAAANDLTNALWL